MKITKMTDQHLINRIDYFERKLANRPSEMIYIGDSVYAEDAVDAENTHNEGLAEDIKIHINEMKEEVKRRSMKELKVIEIRKILVKARTEYHSFMSVRTLKDINSSYDLTATMLRLEANLVGARNSLNKVLGRK